MKRAFVAGDVNLKYHPESLIKWKYWNSNVQNKNVFETYFLIIAKVKITRD